MIRNYRPWYTDMLFWSIFLIDMITKQLAVSFCSVPLVIIKNLLVFRLSFNRGISWGFFHSENPFIFLILSILIFLILCFLAKYTLDQQKIGKDIFGQLLVLAGGFANFTDRIRSGGVIDFIQLSYCNHYFPVFNVADVAITLGVCIMLYSFLQSDDE